MPKSDEVADKVFVAKLLEFTVLFGVGNVAHTFGVSEPTINRWLNYENLPYQSIRKAIVNYTKEQGRILIENLSRSSNGKTKNEA